MNHQDLLKLFRVYVDECIRDTTVEQPIHPLSFDEWHEQKYLPNKVDQDALLDELHRFESEALPQAAASSGDFYYDQEPDDGQS